MSVSRATKMTLLLVAAAALTWGGIELRSGLRCSALEDDYLNAVSDARQAILLRDMAPDSAAMERVSAGLTDSDVDQARKSLTQIYAECGERAGGTAFRKGSAIVLGRNS